MQRYWRLYKAFWRASFIREAEFRANFWAKIATNLLWIGFFVVTLQIVFDHTKQVAGWSREEAFLLTATCLFLESVVYTLFHGGLVEIPSMVRTGTLDFALFKPADSQFWLSARRISLDQAGSLIGAFALGAYALSKMQTLPNWERFGLYFLMILCGMLIFYSFYFMLMTLGIWFVRVENLWALVEVYAQTARFPTDIFDAVLRRIFTYFLPVAFLATIPAKALLGKASPAFLAFAAVWAIAFFVFSRMFWRFSLRHYSSASS